MHNSVMEDCLDKWIGRIYDRIPMISSEVFTYVLMRSKWEVDSLLRDRYEESLVKVQGSTWHGYIGDIARTRMATLTLLGGRKVLVSELKYRKLHWYCTFIFRLYWSLQKVYLFGSALHNWCSTDSDINLLLVIDDKESALEVSMDIFMRFVNTHNDCILVCNESEVETKGGEYRREIFSECEVIYNRKWDSYLLKKVDENRIMTLGYPR